MKKALEVHIKNKIAEKQYMECGVKSIAEKEKYGKCKNKQYKKFYAEAFTVGDI